MSIQGFLLNEWDVSHQIRLSPRTEEGLLEWGSYRARKFASFTRDVYDLPNSTVSINISGSAGRIAQLAGITNVSIGIVSGRSNEQVDVNQIVGTGVFVEGLRGAPIGNVRLGTGIIEGFQPHNLAGNTVYLDPAPIQLLGNVQQITMVEPVDAGALAHRVVMTKYSLMEQLRRVRNLPKGWDGEEAPPIPEATTGTAEEVIKQILEVSLSYLSVPTVRLGPLPDGMVRFECTHSNKELFMTVSENAVEVQIWQPIEAVESVGYWKTDVVGARGRFEWLMK